MDSVNKTLYIPLYGKAYVSRKGILLYDPMAERIWNAEGFRLRGKSKSKWLAYYMGMRSAVFDCWLLEKLEAIPYAVVLHIGCGMDSRAQRIRARYTLWFDLDFPEVIAERKKYFAESDSYKMLPCDVRDTDWLTRMPQDVPVIAVMEGVSMYLSVEELNRVLTALEKQFSQVHVLMDCYTEFAAKASRYKNPINDVGVTKVFGLDDPGILKIPFVKEHEMPPNALIDQLKGAEREIFRSLFAGGIAKKMYRLYEFAFCKEKM